MHDHELAELLGAQKPRETKKDDAGPAGVEAALRAGRPETLNSGGVLHLQRAAGNAGVAAFVQRSAGHGGHEGEENLVERVVKGGGGSPLPAPTRQFFESKMGADLSDVRVHTDGTAQRSAQQVGAHAYTSGNNIAFNAGKYDPSSQEGMRTLAHELTHVVQQRNGPVDGTSDGRGNKVSDPSDQFEQAAEANADAVMAGGVPAQALSNGTGAAGPALQRTAATDEEELQAMAIQRNAEGVAEEEATEDQAEDAPNVAGMWIQREESEGEAKEDEEAL